MGNPLINCTRSLLTDYDQTPATTCRCCGTMIIDAREKRKVSSNTVRPLVPILSRLLGEHYRGEKTGTKIQQLLLPSGSFELKFDLCRQLCLYALQRFQKLETVKSVWKTSVHNDLP